MQIQVDDLFFGDGNLNRRGRGVRDGHRYGKGRRLFHRLPADGCRRRDVHGQRLLRRLRCGIDERVPLERGILICLRKRVFVGKAHACGRSDPECVRSAVLFKQVEGDGAVFKYGRRDFGQRDGDGKGDGHVPAGQRHGRHPRRDRRDRQHAVLNFRRSRPLLIGRDGDRIAISCDIVCNVPLRAAAEGDFDRLPVLHFDGRFALIHRRDGHVRRHGDDVLRLFLLVTHQPCHELHIPVLGHGRRGQRERAVLAYLRLLSVHADRERAVHRHAEGDGHIPAGQRDIRLARRERRNGERAAFDGGGRDRLFRRRGGDRVAVRRDIVRDGKLPLRADGEIEVDTVRDFYGVGLRRLFRSLSARNKQDAHCGAQEHRSQECRKHSSDFFHIFPLLRRSRRYFIHCL